MPSFIPALCLIVTAFMLFWLPILWSMEGLHNFLIKAALMGMAVWSFVAAVTHSANVPLYVLAGFFQSAGVWRLDRQWLKVVQGVGWFVTLFGLLAFLGAVRF